VGVEAHELAVRVGVAIASPGASRLYVAENRAGVAADGIISHGMLQFEQLQSADILLSGQPVRDPE
jgi:hypothetical protein